MHLFLAKRLLFIARFVRIGIRSNRLSFGLRSPRCLIRVDEEEEEAEDLIECRQKITSDLTLSPGSGSNFLNFVLHFARSALSAQRSPKRVIITCDCERRSRRGAEEENRTNRGTK